MSDLNVIAIVPDILRDEVKVQIEAGTFPHAQEIQTRVKFGRKLPDSQAYSFRIADVKTVNMLLKAYPTVELIGVWHVVGPDKTQSFRLDKTLYKSVMPDDITRDAEGNELSRVRPTVLRNVSLWGSQKNTGRDLS